jgi:hypothetical protein
MFGDVVFLQSGGPAEGLAADFAHDPRDTLVIEVDVLLEKGSVPEDLAAFVASWKRIELQARRSGPNAIKLFTAVIYEFL